MEAPKISFDIFFKTCFFRLKNVTLMFNKIILL
jgi:hypothetical protein